MEMKNPPDGKAWPGYRPFTGNMGLSENPTPKTLIKPAQGGVMIPLLKRFYIC